MGGSGLGGSGGDRYGCLTCGATFSTIPSEHGVEVLAETEDSPLADAGIDEGEFITSLNGEEIDDIDDLIDAIDDAPEGEPVEVEVYNPETNEYRTVEVIFPEDEDEDEDEGSS